MSKKVDWEAIEKHYIAGIRTLREIGEMYNVTHGAIGKRAKRDGWTRDLTAKIQAKASRLVVSNQVSKINKLATEREVIDSYAQDIAAIDLSHRADVQRLRKLSQSLMEELELQTTNNEVLTLMANQSQDEGEITSSQSRAIKHLLSSSGRIDSIKKLTETVKMQVELERKIVKLDSALPEGDESQNIVIDFAAPIMEDDDE